MAAVTARLSAFWGAFLHLLLTCVTGLGFEAPARLRAATTPAPAAVPTAAPATAARTAAAGTSGGPVAVPARTPARPGAVPEPRAAVHARTATVPSQATGALEAAPDPAPRPRRRGGTSVPAPHRPDQPYQKAHVPAPRPYDHDRSLPPTMKQRIGAEAHGTTPSARSAVAPLDGLADPLATAATAGRGDAFIPAARRRDRAALCS